MSKFIVILQSAWMNSGGSGINYSWDGEIFDTRGEAIAHGFIIRNSDDFNIGVIESGALVSFDWMDKPMDYDLSHIANEIGFMAVKETTT